MADSLRVRAIEAFPGVGPYNWCLLKVSTEEGLVAWGEAPLGTQPTEGQLRQVRQLLQSENTFYVEKLWRLLARGPAGVAQATEMALWDLAGQALGVPVHQLLGGRLRDRVRVLRRLPRRGGLDARRVRRARPRGAGGRGHAGAVPAGGLRPAGAAGEGGAGLHRPQVRPRRAGAGAAPGLGGPLADQAGDRVHGGDLAAIREHIGDTDFAVDCHARWNTSDAIRLAHALEPYDLLWFEDPVPPRTWPPWPRSRAP